MYTIRQLNNLNDIVSNELHLAKKHTNRPYDYLLDLQKMKNNQDQKFLSWKKEHISLRRMKDPERLHAENGNGGGARFGAGLYTSALSNKSGFKDIEGKQYFILGAVPARPMICKDANFAEIRVQKLINDFEIENLRDLAEKNLTIEKLALKSGFDGLVIPGREMVLYETRYRNLRYFKTIEEVYQYYLNNCRYNKDDAKDIYSRELLKINTHTQSLQDLYLKSGHAEFNFNDGNISYRFNLNNVYKYISSYEEPGTNKAQQILKDIEFLDKTAKTITDKINFHYSRDHEPSEAKNLLELLEGK